MGRGRTTAGWVLATVLTVTACSSAAGSPGASPTTSTSTSMTGPPTTTTTTTTRPAPPLPPPRTRSVTEEAWTPFATVGGVTLVHPASRVEHVGFHQSNHEGARELTVLPTAVAPVDLESRDRLTSGRTAADVVVDPAVEIRAPVTGTVKRAGGYVLYCKYHDDFVVIEPDSHPGWEVKVLHISGVRVHRGERVVAGQTVIAPGPTHLPFASQVDEARTADPAWPHVHVEVVDPSIPNVPSPGGGCS